MEPGSLKLLKTTPVTLMTSLIGKCCPNLTGKGLNKESDVISFGDWRSHCRSSVEGLREATWKVLQ